MRTYMHDPVWCERSLTCNTDEYRFRETIRAYVGVWTKSGCLYKPWPQLSSKGVAEAQRLGFTTPLPELWGDVETLLQGKPGDWVVCTSWTAGDAVGVDIRVLDGKATFNAAQRIHTKRTRCVRLVQLEPGEGGQVLATRLKRVRPDVLVEVRKPRGRGSASRG